MDTSIKPKAEPKEETRIPLAYKCTTDGKFFTYYKNPKCKYCLPVYDQAEIDAVSQDAWRD